MPNSPVLITVKGMLIDSDGSPYEGAIIEAYLNSQMAYSSSLFGNESKRVYSDARGSFEMRLVPSVVDGERENFYVFKIVKDTTNFYKKILAANSLEVNFESLPDYLSQSQRTPLIGNINRTTNANPVTLPQELLGLFRWEPYEADGSQRVFSTEGEIYLVALNGVVQSAPMDYIKRSSNVIEFVSTPLVGDLIAIQYRV